MGNIDRRTFVKLSGASAAALVFGTGRFTERAVARARFTHSPFKLGVASGDPLPGGVSWPPAPFMRPLRPCLGITNRGRV